ncbi:hypothetical protein [Methylobacterium bullatum]|uniref:Uncharacterized protein n=1 Tax=Methylobacterium bullatum TaxID=570505 RepID=A0AAV4Z6I8_9HYPH|nr:hypothetical protein [Methylobacterium bullatum]MBD8900958.1 hypothetical protein [Methylobacterium bullatum]GJD39417.1 hypothetical protein OICFNHDK_1877 [Methylobacterium bullatum]
MFGFLRKLFGSFSGGTNPFAPWRDKVNQGIPNSNGMPTSIEEGMEWQAADFVAAFSHSGSPIDGSKLDYSEASLALVDQVLDDFHRRREPLPDDLHFLTSAYVFEVARRAFGGRYLRGDKDNPFVLTIGRGEAEIGVCVMAKVRGRVVNGPEDSIPFFYAGIAPVVASGRGAMLI